jgi:transposase
LGFTHARHAPEGRPPYDPGDLLKLFIYGYLNRIRSSRMLERECKRNLELYWLLNELIPDHNTIANFRRDNVKAIKMVFRKMVTMCKRLDLIGGKVIERNENIENAQRNKQAIENYKKLYTRSKHGLKCLLNFFQGFLRNISDINLFFRYSVIRL